LQAADKDSLAVPAALVRLTPESVYPVNFSPAVLGKLRIDPYALSLVDLPDLQSGSERNAIG